MNHFSCGLRGDSGCFLCDVYNDFLLWWSANLDNLDLCPFFLKGLHLLNQLVHQGFVVIGERIVADHLMDMFLNLAEYCRTSLRLGCLDDLQNLLKEGVIHLGVINGIIVLPLSILDFHQPGRQGFCHLAFPR